MPSIDLITIARQFGAGGSEIAAAVGRTLGWRVLDREVLRAAAAELKTRESDVVALDESALNTLERLFISFAMSAPEAIPDPTYDVDADAVARVVHGVLRAAATAPPLVVVGHGAQCLFGRRPGTLHVRVIAPSEARAQHVAARESIAMDAARDEVRHRDKQRERYLRHHFSCEPGDASLYSMQVNTAHLTMEQCVAAIVAVVRASGAGA